MEETCSTRACRRFIYLIIMMISVCSRRQTPVILRGNEHLLRHNTRSGWILNKINYRYPARSYIECVCRQSSRRRYCHARVGGSRGSQQVRDNNIEYIYIVHSFILLYKQFIKGLVWFYANTRIQWPLYSRTALWCRYFFLLFMFRRFELITRQLSQKVFFLVFRMAWWW